ncbi:hypothetical protein JCM18916_3969 [Cutibacterium acnes JCM 18916]|nr:hypothetical protein JCM18916_3969 [Cutibacterium acnes JCM 18916]
MTPIQISVSTVELPPPRSSTIRERRCAASQVICFFSQVEIGHHDFSFIVRL